MSGDDFNDPSFQDEYFRQKEGRPSLREINDDVCAMVAFVEPYAQPDDPFLSNDICLAVREAYPGQGGYIGHWLSKLEKADRLPIRRLGTRGTRAIYGIVN